MRFLWVAAATAIVAHAVASAPAEDRPGARRITWTDVAPLHKRLEGRGITASAFPATVQRIAASNLRRVREGDLDHLIFYLLQSARFTRLPSIEPALSAKALAESLDPAEREAFLRTPHVALPRIAAPVRVRVTALLRAIDSQEQDARLDYFRALIKTAFPDRHARNNALLREYLRVMKFLYEKEFLAAQSPRAGDAVSELYHSRGLSTDTAVEAGYLVYQGLGVLGGLDPDRRIRRVLIVGPGLDLAPRTALLEAGPPESYQPWAVIDALVALKLATIDDLDVIAADINPRVVNHLRRSHDSPPALTLVSEIADNQNVSLSKEFREYFAALGAAAGQVDSDASATSETGHLQKVVRIRPEAARALRAEPLDIVTDRLTGPAFDLVIATNILPYFSDVELMLAMTNVALMLAPDGVFLHNEARPLMQEIGTAVRLPVEQSRHAIIASVRGARAPLFDSVWLHRKARDQSRPPSQ